MTLVEFLSTFLGKEEVITLKDEEGNILIRFLTTGYESVDPTILTKVVKSWVINLPKGASKPVDIEVVLGENAPPSPTPTSDTGTSDEGTSEDGTN